MNAISKWLFRAAFLGIAATGAATYAGPLPSRTHSGNGVNVEVTPLVVAADESVWQFRVALETHTQDLSEDLTQVAVLAADGGKGARAMSWEGAAPGGHHRSGILKFRAPAAAPAAIELRIARPGEAKPRVFRWDLK